MWNKPCSKYLLCSFFCVIACFNADSQEIIINSNGEKIVTFKDGTWHFFDENNPKDIEISLTNDMLAQRFIDNEEDLQYYRDLEKKIEFNASWLNEVKMNMKETEDELYVARIPESTYSKQEINLLEEQLKDLKETEKEIKLNLEYFQKEKKKIQTKNKIDEKIKNTLADKNAPTMEGSPNVAKPANVSNAIDKSYLEYNIENDAYLRPTRPDCTFAFEGKDEFSGKNRIDTKKGLFFAYTSDELKVYYKGKNDFIVCYGQISRLEGVDYLSLSIEIASKEAQKSFGMLEKNSVLTIRMVDNTMIKLINGKNSTGIVDNLNGITTYSAQYLLDDAAMKSLRENPVDKVRLVWSTGFEDYIVYNVDFLMNQVACIMTK